MARSIQLPDRYNFQVRVEPLQEKEGLLLFPVAEICFFRCGNFFGLQSWTFSAAGFFLASDGFFPPRTVFSRCLQNVFFCCKGAFVLLQGVFSAALNFSAAKRYFLLVFFPAAKTAFSRCKAFFSCCQTCFFPFRCFFPAANLCFARAARRQTARECRVLHWAFASCKLDSVWTNRGQRRPNIFFPSVAFSALARS